MAYTTKERMETRYGEDVLNRLVSERGDASPSVTSDAVIDEYISIADTMIDAALDPLYTVPLTPTADSATDKFLRHLSEKLAFLLLVRDRQQSLSGKYRDEWDECVQTLEDLGNGTKKILGQDLPSTLNPKSNTTDGRDEIFTSSHYNEDGEKIEDDDYVGSLDSLP